jgi:hypothetical protein
MTRSRLILVAFATVGVVAVVLGRRAPEPNPDPPAPQCEVITPPFPESMTLRYLAKQRLAREAAVGQRSLVEAAALFRELNRLPPRLDSSAMCLPGQSEEEQLCIQVIAYVAKPENDWPPATVEAAVARLEAELRTEKQRAGGVVLPSPAGLPTADELVERARTRLTEAQRRALLPESPPDPPRR